MQRSVWMEDNWSTKYLVSILIFWILNWYLLYITLYINTLSLIEINLACKAFIWQDAFWCKMFEHLMIYVTETLYGYNFEIRYFILTMLLMYECISGNFLVLRNIVCKKSVKMVINVLIQCLENYWTRKHHCHKPCCSSCLTM